jgi:abortive infection bacteriophage resistance protein
MEIKKATTYREQAEKIEQRGCCIESVDDAVRCFESINYYRLSAYFLPFRK